MVTAGILPFKKNSHGRAGNQTRELMIRSQRLWPLDHEAGHGKIYCAVLIIAQYHWLSNFNVVKEKRNLDCLWKILRNTRIYSVIACLPSSKHFISAIISVDCVHITRLNLRSPKITFLSVWTRRPVTISDSEGLKWKLQAKYFDLL